MPRYILIDNGSGYVFGDTADLPGNDDPSSLTPIEAARLLDESIGEPGREYELIGYNPRDTSTGYHVYRADVEGSDAVAVVTDGQDREVIEAVERDCEYVGYVACRDAE